MKISKETVRWFDVKEDAGGARLNVAYLNPGKVREVSERIAKQAAGGKDSNGFPYTQAQIVNFLADALIIECLKGWEKMFDENGKPLPFNEKNVKRAIKEIEGFIEVVTKFQNEIKADIKKENEAQEKN